MRDEREESEMKLTIFAATRRIGRHVLEPVVAAGHDVAHLMLRVLDQPESFKQTIGIANQVGDRP